MTKPLPDNKSFYNINWKPPIGAMLSIRNFDSHKAGRRLYSIGFISYEISLRRSLKKKHYRNWH